MATVGRAVKRWRSLRRVARKIGAIGLVAFLLLPIYSTTDNLHTCTLHRFPFSSHLSWGASAVGDDQTDCPEGIVCQWRPVADTPLTVALTHAMLPTYRLGLSEQIAPQRFLFHTAKPKRAPPSASFSL